MELVFATHNQNKLIEVQQLMPDRISLLSLNDIGCNEAIEETAGTLEGNAWIKAHYIKRRYGYDCFADDTGLEVMALNNAPGVYSARYAGPEKNATANTEKLLAELHHVEDRSAQFRTVIALILEGKEYQFEGICKGQITKSPLGDKGFGYDPVFRPEGFDETFAQMTIDKKGRISHRGLAIMKLVTHLSG